MSQDDNRGLGQGVLDNQPILNVFKLILENVENCLNENVIDNNGKTLAAGYLTASTNRHLKTLLHPMEKFIWHENDWPGVMAEFGADHSPLNADMEVAILRDLPHLRHKHGDNMEIGLVVYRSLVEKCSAFDRQLQTTGIVSLFFSKIQYMVFPPFCFTYIFS